VEKNFQLFEKLEPNSRWAVINSKIEKDLSLPVNFILNGLEQGHKCLYFAHDLQFNELEILFQAKGIEIGKYLGEALVIIPAVNFYLDHQGVFDGQKVEKVLVDLYEETIRQGFSGLTLINDLSWIRCALEFAAAPQIGDLFKKVFAAGQVQLLCTYGVEDFPVEDLMQEMENYSHVLFKIGDEEHAFKGEEIMRMRELVELFYATLVNKTDVERQNNRLSFLNQLISKIAFCSSIEEIVDIVLDKVCSLIGMENGAVYVVEEGEILLKGFRGEGINRDALERMILDQRKAYSALGELREIKYSNKEFQKEFLNSDSLRQLLLNSSVLIPLVAKNKTVGVLVAFSKKYSDLTSVMDEDYFLSIGNAIGMALANIQEQERLHEQMLQSEKLRALGELAGGIAHEFNNILATILGFTQVSQIKNKDPQINEYLDLIKHAAKDGAEIVKRIQRFTMKEEVNKKVNVRIGDLITSAIEMTRPRWKNEAEAKNIRIRIETDFTASPSVFCNASQIREVLVNLILNAVDAMPYGGKIVLRTWQEEDNVFITVEDSGSGIAEKDRKRIFEPFFSTKGLHGTGLGLSICHQIIKEHGGDIHVTSKAGKGSMFIFYLPIVFDVEEVNEVRETLLFGKNIRNSILVIDDEEKLSKAIKELLISQQYRVKVSNTGRGGVELFKKDSFDLVLCDLAIPDCSGTEVAKRIKAVNRHVPIVLITGWLTGIKQEDLDNIDYVLEKPFELNSLLAIIEELLRQQEMRNSI
jgi:signal transduction histidine kinase/ActR/RegA family two-component response regulator